MAGNQFGTNLGLDIFPVTTDPDNAFDITRLYNACKTLAASLDNFTGAIGKQPEDWSQIKETFLRLQNMTRLYVIFSENVSSGNMIALYNNAGVLTARKAGGPSFGGGLARGFVQAPVTSGQYGEVFLGGANAYISGMTPGSPYYLSAGTAGLITGAASSPYLQEVGFAVSSSVLWFAPTPYSR